MIYVTVLLRSGFFSINYGLPYANTGLYHPPKHNSHELNVIYWVPFLYRKPLVKNTFFGSFPKHALRWWISKVRTWIWSKKSTCSTCRCYGFMIRFWISPTKTQNTFLHFLRKTHSPKNKATPRRHSLLLLLFLENKRCRHNEVGCERI